jgi:predicted outer membrane repeat protein
LTISGNGHLAFDVQASVSMSGLTVANSGASAFLVSTALTLNNCVLTHNVSGIGGAIDNQGTTTVSNTTFSYNQASGAGGAIWNQGPRGTMTITGCTFVGNSAGDFGGAIYNRSAMTVTDSTFASNYSDGVGGAIYNDQYATLTLTFCTISRNSAANGGGGILNQYGGGTLHFVDTIDAGNTAGDLQINGGTITYDHSLVGGNPMLGPLQDNGGPTLTMAPLAGSPAIDGGSDVVPPADQRGQRRPAGNRPDIGAYEVQNRSNPEQAVRFDITGIPATTTAGQVITFKVTPRLADGSVDFSYSGTVHFTSSDPQAGLPAGYTFFIPEGPHTFTVALKTAGPQSFTVADSTYTNITGTVSGIQVNPAAVTHFALAASASVITHTPVSLTVSALDAYGNVVSGYRGTVTFSDSWASGGMLPTNYTFTAGDAGVHKFTNQATFYTIGAQTITVSDTAQPSLRGSASVFVTGVPSRFVLSTRIISIPIYPGGPTIEGVALTIKITDSFGNVVPSYAGTIQVSDSNGAIAIPANYTFTTSNAGVVTLYLKVLKRGVSTTLSVTDTSNKSITGSVSLLV